jgi:hypothetical protein
MITIHQALGWLNQFDQSHSSEPTEKLLVVARDRRTATDVVREVLKAALDQAQAAPLDDLEYPETLLHCAAIEMDRGLYSSARDHCAEAETYYRNPENKHRHVIALWMLGIVQLRLDDTDSCHRNWGEVFTALEDLNHRHRHHPATQSEYKALLEKLRSDILTLPQASFRWLNRFDGSNIQGPNRKLVETMNACIDNRQFDMAYQKVTELKAIAVECEAPLEAAEIWTEIGLGAYRMTNLPEAVNALKSAILKYSPGSHQLQIVRWMLGAIQWPREKECLVAKRHWERSLDGFYELSTQNDYANRQSRREWYDEQLPYMKKALDDKIADYL